MWFLITRHILKKIRFPIALMSMLAIGLGLELLENELHFIDDLGLKQHLSPTRSNGLLAMVKQIRLYAVAYSRIEGNKEKING